MRDNSLKQLCAAGSISVKLQNALMRNGIYDLDKVLELKNRHFDFMNLYSFGYKCQCELESFLLSLPDSLLSDDDSVTPDGTVGRFSQPVSPLVADYLALEYDRHVSAFQTSSANAIRYKFPDYRSLDSIRLNNRGEVSYQFFNPHTKTYNDLNTLYNDFIALYDEALGLSDIDIIGRIVRMEFPFLSDQQADFVTSYTAQHDNYPMFYLFRAYLMSSVNRYVRIIRRSAGMMDGKAWSPAELGKHHNLTDTRISEIIRLSLADINPALASHSGWTNYSELFASPYLTEDSASCLDVISAENLQCSAYSFLRMVAMVAPLRFENLYGRNYAVSYDLESQFSIRDSVRALRVMLAGRRTKDTIGDISDCIPDSVSYGIVRQARSLLTDIAVKALGVSVSPIGEIFLPFNCIDVTSEVRSILQHAGHIMHIDQITECINRRFPGRNYTPSRVRHNILPNSDIRPVGKTLCFGLSSWTDVCFSTISDALYEILSASDTPMTCLQAYGALCDKGLGFSTSSRSVGSLLSSDPRFENVGRGLYAVVSSRQIPA